jgi:hypothetical protein
MKLCPTEHTGRKLPHHHTSYLGLSVLLVMVGFALGATTLTASAVLPPASLPPISGSVAVTANVSGSVPISAPTILVPISGQTLSTNPIKISGDCSPGLIVEIRKNGYLGGAARCDSNGSFRLKVDLLIGSNRLIARQYNGVGSSPDSTPILLTYRPNIPPIPTPQTQLLLQSDIFSQAGSIDETIRWNIQIMGGAAPYALNWDWGDGSIDLKSITSAGLSSLSHSYHDSGVHTIIVTATDQSGQTASLQLTEYTPATAVASPTKRNEVPGTVLTIWPLFFMAVFLVWVFFIGERYGEIHERKRPHLEH